MLYRSPESRRRKVKAWQPLLAIAIYLLARVLAVSGVISGLWLVPAILLSCSIFAIPTVYSDLKKRRLRKSMQRAQLERRNRAHVLSSSSGSSVGVPSTPSL